MFTEKTRNAFINEVLNAIKNERVEISGSTIFKIKFENHFFCIKLDSKKFELYKSGAVFPISNGKFTFLEFLKVKREIKKRMKLEKQKQNEKLLNEAILVLSKVKEL